jgi:CheY-like chemotaxis protein
MTRILIVEDNADQRLTMKNLLSELGEIYECSDGEQAVTAYDRLMPDWVLMDIRMGRMSGITATRRIKTAHPDAHIIIVTGYDDDGLRAAARRAGAQEYVLKSNLAEVSRLLIEADRQRNQ